MKVFCATYGGGHVKILESIYKDMIKNEIEVSILAFTLADVSLNSVKIPHKTISDYVFLMNSDKIKENGDKVFEKIHNSSSGIKEEDSRAYYGIGLTDLVEKYGEEGLNIYEELGRKAFNPVKYMEKVLKYEKPDLLLLMTGVRFEKALAIAANNMNIPVVLINDLPIVANKPEFDANICVMNKYAKIKALEKGYDDKKVFVTGQPVMENNLKIDENKACKSREEIAKRWDKVILYLGLPQIDTLPEGMETIISLKEIAEKNKNWLIIIRPHPSNFDNYNTLNMDNLYVTKEGELKYIIDICDVAITQGSTSGIEAALLDKPVVTVLNVSELDLRLDELGIATNIEDAKDIEKNICRLLDEKDELAVELMEKRSTFKNKENSVENIINVIRKVTENEA